MSRAQTIAVLVAALGCGLNAGIFFTFSSFVMAALKELPPSQGIAAMQSINRYAVTALFMTALFGTAVLCLGLGIWAAMSLDQGWAVLVVVACVLYIVGTILVTIIFNVPMNNRLEGLPAGDPDSAAYWSEYLRDWTRWNHLRTIASLAASVLLTLALRA